MVFSLIDGFEGIRLPVHAIDNQRCCRLFPFPALPCFLVRELHIADRTGNISQCINRCSILQISRRQRLDMQCYRTCFICVRRFSRLFRGDSQHGLPCFQRCNISPLIYNGNIRLVYCPVKVARTELRILRYDLTLRMITDAGCVCQCVRILAILYCGICLIAC